MSKYIKLEDAEKLLTNALRIAQGFDEPLERSLVDLPTIEVSDEQLSKLQSSENSVENTTASEDFTSISRANSKLEVSEDAISREYMLEVQKELQGYMPNEKNYELWDKIKNAPSVVPQAKEGEWVEIGLATHSYKCSVCGRMLMNITDGKKNVAKNYPYCHCGAKMKGAEDDSDNI